ncbi:unnamed protein product [Musa acuminata subsp. burmannicoides]
MLIVDKLQCLHALCSHMLSSFTVLREKEGALLRAASNLPQQHNHKSPPSAQKKTISKDGDCSNGKVKAYSCCVAATVVSLQCHGCRMQGRGEEKARVRSLVGSRPPICERRCITCGHCEAVQVPVIPQEKKSRSRQFLGTATVRGDYSSNYKPLSWKCKCGDLIFDP